MRQPLVFATQSAEELSSRQGSRERLLNLYAEPRGDGVTLRTTLGLSTQLAQLGAEIRAIGEHQGKLYAVAGSKLWNATTGQLIGTVGGGDATLASDGVSLAIAAGGKLFVYDGTSITAPSTGAFSNIGSAAFASGRIVITERDGGRFSVSGVYDADSYDALDFATAEDSPDDVMRVMRHFGEVVLFGRTTIEFWAAAAGDFPFSRSQVIERGTNAPTTIAKLDNALYWLGDDLKVYRAFTYNNERISTHPLERIIEGYDPTTLKGFLYRDGGHDIYALRFPDRPAWCYDAATQLWHERGSGLEDGAWNAVAAHYDRVGRRWIVGTRDGKIRVMSGRETDEGEEYLRLAQSRPLWLGGEEFEIPSLEARMRVGRATDEPVVRFSYSRDGETWKPERERSMGAQGKYDRKVVWRALGQHCEFHARLKVTDAVDVQIYGASAEVA